MKIVLIGSVKFSLDALQFLVEKNAEIVGVCTKPTPTMLSDHVDLSSFSNSGNIPWIHASDINSEETINWIESKKPDVIFCFGWPNLLKEPILNLSKIGVVGFHPTQIPANRGRHPIIWTLALGLQETASSFFLMDSGADSGNIISQETIQVLSTDYAADLYEKITAVALSQLENLLPNLMAGNVIAIPQNLHDSNIWRKRSSTDGRIDWRMSSNSIYNLIRALSHPYPGAHFEYKNSEYKVFRAELVDNSQNNLEPGKVLMAHEGVVEVKCGEGAIRLLGIKPTLDLKEGMYI